MAEREIRNSDESETATDHSIAHDAWFRAEVEAAVREADDPNAVWVSHDDVKAQMAARRVEWQRRLDEKESPS